VLIGNKTDLEDEREVTFLEASRFAQENGMNREQQMHPSSFVGRQCDLLLLTFIFM